MFELARHRSNRTWPRFGSLPKLSACLSCLLPLILSGCVQYSLDGAEISRTKPVTHYLPGTTGGMSHGLRQCSNTDQATNPNKAKPASYPSLMTQPGRHAPGDVIRLDLTDGEGFGGVYELNPDGTLILPYAGPVRAAGLTTASLAGVIRKTLVSKGYFQERQIDVSVVPLRWAPAQQFETQIFGRSLQRFCSNPMRPYFGRQEFAQSDNHSPKYATFARLASYLGRINGNDFLRCCNDSAPRILS